jgi:transcriptional regulator with XRE-family HTH domain
MLAMSIGDKIRAKRLARGLSQRGLGRLLNVSNSAVSQWESGEIVPELPRRIDLSRELDIPILELMPELQGQTKQAELSPDEAVLVEKYRELSGPLQETYLRLLLVQASGKGPDPK